MQRSLFLLSVCVLSCAVPAAHAQWSAYGAATLTDYGYQVSSGNGLGFKGLSGGVMGGAFYNFDIQSRLTVAADFRAVGSPGTKGGEFFAADLRFGFVPTRVPLRPFLGIGGGVTSVPHGALLFNNNSTRSTGGGLLLDFGLDVRLTSHVDYRVLDYGGLGGPTAGTGFLATGVVYHFTPRQPRP